MLKKTMLNNVLATALVAAGAFGATQAMAQSHSVVNYSNPPGTQADTKHGTEATPSHTATADQQDIHHAGKGARDAAANKGKNTAKPAQAGKGSHGAKGTRASIKADPDISRGQAGNQDKETMQRDPSEAGANVSEQHAFDVTPSKK